ncbi:MAG: bile acid:sodium symporter [Deltaproteobacteria bacterium]
MSFRDLLLFAVIFGSVAAAVFFPAQGTVFQPYLLYFMMTLLFLSFLRIDFRSVLDVSSRGLIRLGMLVTAKLIILPSLLYGAVLLTVPEYAVPTLLLSGISTGVVAPFIAAFIAAEVVQVLQMVIVSSIIVPFSLPALVKLLAGARIEIPLETMVRLLSLVIFVPIGAVLILRRWFPGAPEKIAVHQYPISLAIFAIINLGVFSKYSSFFFGNPGQVFVSVAVAYALCAIYYAAGFLITPGLGRSERLAAGVSLAVINNVLVIVFSSRFFGPLSPLLAAMYMFPFFTMIIPVKLIANLRANIPHRGEEL